MMVSTFLITILGTIITEKVVAPRFGEYHGNGEENETSSEYKLNDQERTGSESSWFNLTGYDSGSGSFLSPG